MKSISKYDAKILTIFHGDETAKASLKGTLMAAFSVTMNEKKLLTLLNLLTEEKKNVFFWVLKSCKEAREREKQERRTRLKLL